MSEANKELVGRRERTLWPCCNWESFNPQVGQPPSSRSRRNRRRAMTLHQRILGETLPATSPTPPRRGRWRGLRAAQGTWIMLARGLWISLVIFTLAIFGASLPVYLAQLQTPCAGSACAYQQLSPEQVEVLKGLGFSPSDYATYTIALTLASMVVCFLVSTLIVWRRSDDRLAVLVALMLVTFGPLSATISVSASPSPWRVPAACLAFLALALFVLVFLLFPTGQFVPRWTRWIAVVCLALLVPSIFFPNNPLAQNPDALLLFYLVSLVAVATLALVQLYRYRRVSSPLQRQQTKWVVFGLAVPCSVLVGGYGLSTFPALGDPSAPAGASYQLALTAILSCTLLIPLSFGFAMLRSRLW